VGKDYIDVATVTKQVAALRAGEDMYMDVGALSAVESAEDLYICVEKMADVPSKAKQLVEEFQNEDIYQKPESAPTEWHVPIAQKLGLDSEAWYYGAIPRERAERLVLDQAFGKFLVRVSIKKKKQAYAISVSMGKLQFMHIAVAYDAATGRVSIDGMPFNDIRKAIDHFSTNQYNGLVKLTGSIIVKKMKSSISSEDGPPPPPPPRPGRKDDDDVPPPPPARPSLAGTGKGARTESVYMEPKMDFMSDHIYSTSISDDDDDYDDPNATYEDPNAGQEAIYLAAKKSAPPSTSTRSGIAARSSIKQQPMPLDVSTWTAGEVQRWLKENSLGDFKAPFYANGVTGRELLVLKGNQFPPKRFSPEIRAAFDTAIEKLKKRHKPGASGSAVVMPLAEDTPPPVPARPSAGRL